ncbi:MAG: slr1659 superfamily regulator [Planktothrix sp.]|uniref:slr1659 superfamily regulator n=1 Tax=Planktothrix sp. TaxID=3088171 RepID=UPI0038D37B2E
MAIQEIKGEDHIVQYDPESVTICFQGELSLGGPVEYEPIKSLLDQVTATKPPLMTLDLRNLSFLNSSGISLLSKFVMSLRKKPQIQLIILGTKEVAWQDKSLQNLKKFLPSLQLNIE